MLYHSYVIYWDTEIWPGMVFPWWQLFSMDPMVFLAMHKIISDAPYCNIKRVAFDVSSLVHSLLYDAISSELVGHLMDLFWVFEVSDARVFLYVLGITCRNILLKLMCWGQFVGWKHVTLWSCCAGISYGHCGNRGENWYKIMKL